MSESVTARTLLKTLSGLPKRLAESIRCLPVAAKSPSTLFIWLKRAHAAQIVLVLSLVLVPTVLPRALDSALELIFPPVTEKKLFGLIERTHENPHLEGVRTAGRVILFIGAFGTVSVLLLLQLPKTINRSGNGPSGESSVDRTTLMEPPLPTSSPGDRFRLVGVLGRGGVSIVHLAQDTVLDRKVALKELYTVFGQDERILFRFRQEAKILGQLTHPGIVQLYDFLEKEGRFWIVMEYVGGGELTALLSKGPVEVPQAAGLGMQLADALSYAHGREVIHRDFKPSNVLLSKHGTPKITDFGLARLAQAAGLTQKGSVLGSPAYMSPEQAEAKSTDERTDIYSLGVVLYQALAGRPPFEGENLSAVMTQHISKKPVPLQTHVADMPAELDGLVLKMLAKEPARRPQSMDEVAAELSPFARI
jgi:hypothetical protein